LHDLRAPPWYRRTLAAVLAAGVLLRLAQYLSNQSLFVDEAMLSLNIASRSWLDLLAPLDYGQTAPVPFLWAERLAIAVGGVNAFALRAIPLLAGLALPFVTWRFSRRLLGAREALLATAFAAVSPILIQFSAMVKPYVIDALVAVVLADFALDVITTPESSKAWVRLLAAGVVGLLVSIPALFVLGGVWAALALAPSVRQGPGHRVRLGLATLLWGTVFTVQYLLLYRPVATSPYMHEYWADSFLAPGAPDLARHTWLAAEYLLLNAFVGSRPQAWAVVLFLLFLAAGVWALARRRGLWAAALAAGAVAAAVGASAVERYPVAPRMMVFAVPYLALLLAAGFGATADAMRRPFPYSSWAVALLAIGWLLVPFERDLRRPYRADGVRPLAAQVARERDGSAPGRQPDVPVYVYAAAVPAWAFYTTDWSAPDTARLRFLARVASPGGPAFHNAAGRPAGRVVEGEGRHLVVRTAMYWELIGTPPGTQYRELTRWSQESPDPGWAENEAARIRATGARQVWVVTATSRTEPIDRLRRALGQLGAVEEFGRLERNARLYRYRFLQQPDGPQ